MLLLVRKKRILLCVQHRPLTAAGEEEEEEEKRLSPGDRPTLYGVEIGAHTQTEGRGEVLPSPPLWVHGRASRMRDPRSGSSRDE